MVRAPFVVVVAAASAAASAAILSVFVGHVGLVILIIVHMTLFNTVRCTIMRSSFV